MKQFTPNDIPTLEKLGYVKSTMWKEEESPIYERAAQISNLVNLSPVVVVAKIHGEEGPNYHILYLFNDPDMPQDEAYANGAGYWLHYVAEALTDPV